MNFRPKIRVERWRKFHAPNAAMLRLEMEQEGYRVYQWSDVAGMFYGLHNHEEPQSHWIVSGSLEITVGGQTYTLEAGDRDFLEAETWHTARVVGETHVVYLVGEKIIEKPVESEPPPKRKRGRPKKRKD